MRRISVPWSRPDVVEHVHAAYARGESATQIAASLSKMLGEKVTRNQVIGRIQRDTAAGRLKARSRIHRAQTAFQGGKVHGRAGGLAAQEKAAQEKASRPRPPKAAPKPKPAPVKASPPSTTMFSMARPGQSAPPRPLPVSREPDLPMRRVGLLELEPGECRFPVGYARAHLFCGLGRHAEGPYCPHHASIARSESQPGSTPVKATNDLIRSMRRFQS